MYRHKKILDCEGGADELIRFIPIGDIHWLTESTDIAALQRVVEQYAGVKNTYFFGLGDWFDLIYALPSEKRYDVRAQARTLEENKSALESILAPIAGQFIAVLDGNHEERFNKCGIGSPVIAWAKGKPAFYGGYSCFVGVTARWIGKKGERVKSNALEFYLHHGWFSGRKKGAKVNNMEDTAASFDTNIYLFGHSHDLITSKRVMMNRHGAEYKVFVNSGTFSKTNTWGHTTYGERAGYPPTVCGDVVEILWYPWQRHGKMNGKIKILM